MVCKYYISPYQVAEAQRKIVIMFRSHKNMRLPSIDLHVKHELNRLRVGVPKYTYSTKPLMMDITVCQQRAIHCVCVCVCVCDHGTTFVSTASTYIQYLDTVKLNLMCVGPCIIMITEE